MSRFNGKHLKISKTVFNTFQVIETPIRFKSNYSRNLSTFKSYDFKLDNSVSRARSTIFNLTLFNKFDYFYTQTIDSRFNRQDLNIIINKFRSTLKYLRKLNNNVKFDYVIVPEFHSDKKSWHVHGFLNSSFKDFIYVNKNGFLSVKYLDNIGFNSVQPIRNYLACCKYFTKYITKELCISRGKGDHVYYCSSGLVRDNSVFKAELSQIAPIHYDFKSSYCFKTMLSESKYYNLITRLDNLSSTMLIYN